MLAARRAILRTILVLGLVGAASMIALWGLIGPAEEWSEPEFAMSFFLAALGTSLTELVFAITAVRRGEVDLAVRDLFGSPFADATLSVAAGPVLFPVAVTAEAHVPRLADVNGPVLPILDLGGAAAPPSAETVEAVAAAAENFGFFQIVNHGISPGQLATVWDATRSFFAQPTDDKRQILRTKENSRGYYDRELTKNARDLKEVLDIAHVPHPELADDHPTNFHAVDGVNQWPDLEGFRTTFVEHLQSCERLSHWLLEAFCRGLGEHADHLASSFGDEHTSFVRLNYYPLHDPLDHAEAATVTALGDMALHHHSDAGAFTLLVQDDVGGLQVEHNSSWIDVEPIAGAIVVNTGDMMQVWSNDRYQAALHRVVPRIEHARYSLPYFFNPSYATDYFPLPGSIGAGDRPRYGSINWGEFRQARADGDFADYGSEVQISDFIA